ncbi:P-loop containing nucleoside triphosphate hydrolase, partial [Pleurotus pulmonarius]
MTARCKCILPMKRTEEVLGKRLFDWQIGAAAAILCGEDVVLDVGTGCGKSLCFSMPLVLHESDIALRITPLTALMIDQADSSQLHNIALCGETMGKQGAEEIYKHILSDKCREVYVSPEMAISPEFRKQVLSKKQFHKRLRLVAIDEAHCISLWL